MKPESNCQPSETQMQITNQHISVWCRRVTFYDRTVAARVVAEVKYVASKQLRL